MPHKCFLPFCDSNYQSKLKRVKKAIEENNPDALIEMGYDQASLPKATDNLPGSVSTHKAPPVSTRQIFILN